MFLGWYLPSLAGIISQKSPHFTSSDIGTVSMEVTSSICLALSSIPQPISALVSAHPSDLPLDPGDTGPFRWMAAHTPTFVCFNTCGSSRPLPYPGFGLGSDRGLEGLWVEVDKMLARGVPEQFPETWEHGCRVTPKSKGTTKVNPPLQRISWLNRVQMTCQ